MASKATKTPRTGIAKGAEAQASLIAAGCPDVIRDLDLGLPALLEASAGTGKTYAIEHLVLRILTELEDVDLDQVLVLTFTEKATGELKEKIRARIARRLAEPLPPATAARLKEAHLNFDRACVFTIHGFCQRMLRNYAFENRALFRAELADDGEVLDRVLTEEMRSTWLSDAGPAGRGLEGFRRLAERLAIGPSGHWKRKLLRLARDCNPFRGDRLLPAYAPERVRACAAEALEALADLQGNLHVTPSVPAREHPLYLALKDAKFHPPGRKKAVLELCEEALALADAARGPDPVARLAAARDFLNRNARKEAVREGFAWMRPESFAPGTSEVTLESAVAALDRLRLALAARAREEKALEYEPQRSVVATLRREARAYKSLHGLMSFDDMIEDLCAALRGKPDLMRALRRQFRFCIVDEFQDTDPLQWEIFRTVFLDSRGANPLYLIGDPKQAIYGFRGGDIFTYLAARADLLRLSREGRARGFSLDANYRSSAAMVAACNRIFAHPGWFRIHAADAGDEAWRLSQVTDPLGYLPVKHGGLAIQECRESSAAGSAGGASTAASKGRNGPVILKDFSAQTLKPECQRAINHWVTSEIRALMSPPVRMQIPEAASSPPRFRPLDWGDICVLVKTHREKRLLEAAFQKAGIPFQIHKRAGLYQSDAAGHFLALLESLDDPRDAGKHARALLTRFFRAPDDAPPQHPPVDVHPAFETWARLAHSQAWQRLFHELLYGTGLLYRECLEADGERRVMDFLHLAQNLVQEALRDNLALPALVQRLRELRDEAPDGEEEKHLHREDSESRKVLIMTMHTSKGLEFPMVFLAGLSGSMPSDYHRYHDEGGTVFHLDKQDKDAAEAARSEADDEERRLFYVALTRARYKLFLPLPPPMFGKRSPCPLGGFVADAVRAAAAGDGAALFAWASEPGNVEVTGNSGAAPDADPHPGEDASPRTFSLSDFTRDDSPAGPAADFFRRRRRMSSYSHLVKRGPALAPIDLEGRYDKEEAPEADTALAEAIDAEDAAEAYSAPAVAAPGAPGNALPRGRETGNMFHEILETIDFARVAGAETPEALWAHAPTRDLISARMLEHGLTETHGGDVAKVVWHVLRAPLPDPAGGESFRLCDVADRRAEMEFLFPVSAGAILGGTALAGGYLGGYMDLVFRRQGRYYLLDWKSNWLESYGPDAVADDVRASRYDLQYQLYAIALDKWLRDLVPDYDFARDFGGIYYLYLRGMRGEPASAQRGSGSPPGVFALKPTPRQIAEEFPARLNEALGAAGMAPIGKGFAATGEPAPAKAAAPTGGTAP